MAAVLCFCGIVYAKGDITGFSFPADIRTGPVWFMNTQYGLSRDDAIGDAKRLWPSPLVTTGGWDYGLVFAPKNGATEPLVVTTCPALLDALEEGYRDPIATTLAPGYSDPDFHYGRKFPAWWQGISPPTLHIGNLYRAGLDRCEILRLIAQAKPGKPGVFRQVLFSQRRILDYVPINMMFPGCALEAVLGANVPAKATWQERGFRIIKNYWGAELGVAQGPDDWVPNRGQIYATLKIVGRANFTGNGRETLLVYVSTVGKPPKEPDPIGVRETVYVAVLLIDRVNSHSPFQIISAFTPQCPILRPKLN